jgi:hypothetical protein
MSRNRFLCFLLIVLFLACFMFEGIVYAQQDEAVKQENKAVKFFKNIFIWPFSVTKQGAETVGRTTKAGVTTVTDTGTSAVQTVTGKPEKIKDVVVGPIKGTAQTGYTAVEGSIKTPIEGTREAFE